MSNGIRLEDVYHDRPGLAMAKQVLFDLLLERETWQSISHRKMPTWDEHEAFVESRPYLAWYLIRRGQGYCGATYLSHQREVGIAIFRSYAGKGLGESAVRELLRLHPGIALANVAPGNDASHKLFGEKLGGRLIQMTYELPVVMP